MRRYYSGLDVHRTQSIAELAVMARRRLPHFAWEYLEGGAEEEWTLRRNRQAFADLALLPRTLVPCSATQTRCSLLGRDLPLPMAIGPTGYNAMLYRDADIQLARAATARGLPFTLSTVSTSSLEQLVAAVPEVNLWFQLYCLRDPSVREDLLQRAHAVGCKTLLLTSDAVLLGNREWDRRNFVRPRQLSLRNKLDVLRHPRWMAQALWPHGLPNLGNIERYLPTEQRTIEGAAQFIGSQMDSGLDWDALARLRERWPHRLLLKGVLHPADAEKAVALGLDGLVVSNHGGRQLDGVPASLDCLPAVAAVAKGKLALLLDSGVRRGTDILKACALGADAVLLGRSTLYGVAIGGQAGAGHALDLLAQELRLALSLLGTPDLKQLDCRALITTSSSFPDRELS
ncbi:(S)-mandelate dehydrogenase [Pseudomonas chlororaphis]|uniref:alpha-hydroxy acid oxidase n=1 Tax=Pseudomonas TaxID=286 RepID=UPI00087C463D|nr:MULTISPECIES: alpha-hydroxy acid oxidase [Pseudomonas]AZD67457.1 L-lactate dehydrogenase [Pseudomonas chlororaphis subsp. aurantiaca]PWY51316.1 alpha-hydroxy-acid oxidizing protein [Pseudomonas sp. RW409]QHC90629.1 alpha-hydroxy-acid oxidizing enzyme [Pseudomonas chlororaphis]QIT23435.1 alpha-hydroxy-acid oxidizing protein [Pseudomonas chlororaphis subsp. aurantiaca]QTT82970.1 alpha-hydroxy-acid oxidizing protein [Pseudomonas chlororaphis]